MQAESRVNEVIFKDLKNMLDFGSKNSYGNEVTYFDPSRGWVLAYHEESNEDLGEGCRIG